MVQGPGINGICMCNDKDGGGYGGFSAAQEFQNPLFGSVDSNGDAVYGFIKRSEAANKRIKLTESNQKGVKANTFEELTPLGLTLSKTPSFLDLLQKMLSPGRNTSDSADTNPRPDCGRVRAKVDDFVSQPMSEKLKASNFCATLLRIGTWERASQYEGDLVAKCYFAKRKLVWEVLEKSLKKKIELQWCDILAIRATIQENEPGILEIELNQPPAFFQETNPQPRKHTLWQITSDFTGGQAPIFRRHYLKFAPGALDKHYEKLLQCDNRLLKLSQRPFPSLQSPYFYSNFNNVFQEFSRYLNANVAEIPHGLHYHPLPSIPSSSSMVASHPVQSFEQTTKQSLSINSYAASPMSDGNSSNRRFENPTRALWANTRIGRGDQIHELPYGASASQVSPAFFNQDYHRLTYGEGAAQRPKQNNHTISDIEKILLSDSQVVCSDERTLFKTVMPMNSLLEPTEGVNFANVTTVHKDLREDRAPSNHLVPSISTVEDALIYPQPINENLLMHLQMKNSLYPYEFSGMPREDFATIDTLNGIKDWK